MVCCPFGDCLFSGFEKIVASKKEKRYLFSIGKSLSSDLQVPADEEE